jgi:hypothetical protein
MNHVGTDALICPAELSSTMLSGRDARRYIDHIA